MAHTVPHMESDDLSSEQMVALLIRSIPEWNAWRNARPRGRLDLSQANLSYLNLAGADLSWTSLTRANFYKSRLVGARLDGANLCGANYVCSEMTKAQLEMFEGANAKTVTLVI